MLKFGNKEFRNLQEQVLKNMQNIANINEGTAVLSEFGIKVVGEVDSVQDLPTVADYKTAHEDWEYGDAFAIGTEAPYTLVILTRANDDITADHWFDIGSFPAPGPQGERGPQGEQGVQGQTGDTGPAGNDAGFGSVLATAQTLSAGSSATATVTASGPNTAKEFSFVFGIPRGADGGNPVWGNIQGTLADQTDLKNALDAKQDELVSGTNIKTINSQSVVGEGNIEINSGVWGNITGTLSDQTDLVNALAAKQDVIDASHKLPASNVSGLATVATSGSYDDLSDKPTIPAAQVQSDWTQSNSAAVDYIKNKPTIPAAQVNSDWNAVSGVAQILNKPNLATVATSGSYEDLSNKPNIPAAQVQSDYAQSDSSAVDYIKNKPDLSIYAQSANLATVATTGDYDDLLNKPSIPAAQVQSDYTQSDNTQVDYIKNKPDLSVYALSSSLATVATSGDYDDLTDKPTIGDATLTIQKNGTTVDTFTANATNDKTINITVPTNADYVDLTSAQTNIDGSKRFIGASVTIGDNTILSVDNALVKAGWPIQDGSLYDYDAYYYANGIVIEDAENEDSNDPYYLAFPAKNGTLAVTSDIPTVGNGTLTIQRNGTTLDTFSANTSSNKTVNIIVPTNSDYVDLSTAQTITNNKTWHKSATQSGSSYVKDIKVNITNTTGGVISNTVTKSTGGAAVSKFSTQMQPSGFLSLKENSDTEYTAYKYGQIDIQNTNSLTTITLPSTSGTLALTSDIPSIPVQDVTVGGVSVLSGTTAVIPAIPTVPTNVSSFTNDAGYITGINSSMVTTALGYTPLANTACTYQTTAPTAAATDGGVHIVYLNAEPATKYAGYIYMIAEA